MDNLLISTKSQKCLQCKFFTRYEVIDFNKYIALRTSVSGNLVKEKYFQLTQSDTEDKTKY